MACLALGRNVSASITAERRLVDLIPMQSSAKTVPEYLEELPADRRAAISAVRDVILANLPKGYEERMSYGMIGYVVPHSIYPKGYQCNPKLPLPFVNLGSQKNHMALYLMCCYSDPELKDGSRKLGRTRARDSTWAAAASDSRDWRMCPWK